MSTEDRIERVESAFVMLSNLVQSHGERFDTHREWLNELGARMVELAAAQAELTAAQANTEQKLAALVDAQIRTEEELRRLSEAQDRSDQRMDSLADTVKRVLGARGGEEGL